jgi:exonuclease VII small subunit
MDNEQFQVLVLEQLKMLTQSVKELEQGQNTLVQSVSALEEGQKSLEQSVSSLEEGQKNLEQNVKLLEYGQKELAQSIEKLDEGVGRLEQGQRDIRNEFKYAWQDIRKIDSRLSTQEEEVVILKRQK